VKEKDREKYECDQKKYKIEEYHQKNNESKIRIPPKITIINQGKWNHQKINKHYRK
jgi:hypothetical protein